MNESPEERERIADFFDELGSTWKGFEAEARNPLTRGFARLMQRYARTGAKEYRGTDESSGNVGPDHNPPM